MKITLLLTSLSLLLLSFSLAAKEKKLPQTGTSQVDEKYLDQEVTHEKIQREEDARFFKDKPLNNSKHDPYIDNGNGLTTNPRINNKDQRE